MLRALIVTVWLLSLPVGTTTDTQAPAPPQGPGRQAAAPADPDTIPPPVLAEMLDTYAIFQAQRALSIADDKNGPFLARLKKLQDVRRRNTRQRLQMIRELNRLVGPRVQTPADDATIRAKLAALREHDDRAAAELRLAYDALDELLDAKQQARFRLFEEEMERRKLDLLVRARERANRPVKR
jgi:hypothetical protein